MLCISIMGRFVSNKWAIVDKYDGQVLHKADKSQDLYINAGLTKPTGKLSVAQAVCKLHMKSGTYPSKALCAFKDGAWWVAVDTLSSHKGQAEFYWSKITDTDYLGHFEDAIRNLDKAFGSESEPVESDKKIDWHYDTGSNAGDAWYDLMAIAGIEPARAAEWLQPEGESNLEHGEHVDLGNGFSVGKHSEENWVWIYCTETDLDLIDFSWGENEYSIALEWMNAPSEEVFNRIIDDIKKKAKESKPKTTTKTSTKTMDANQQLAEAIKAIAGQTTQAVDIEQVKAVVAEEMRKASVPQVVTLEVKLPTKSDPNKVGMQHKDFDKLLNLVANKVPVMMTGDAGSGKTFGAKSVAKALDLDFRIFSFTNETSLGRTMGFMNATGEYVRTAVRDMYENGGVLILDEFDAANPNVAMALNNLLDGDEYTFDDGQIARHPEFRYVACTNTYGKGANKQFNARNKMDDATMDRFVYMAWEYDEVLERNIFGNTEATEVVLKIRANANKMGMNGLVTPRRTREVNKMVSIGFSVKDAVQMAILNPHKGDVQKGLLEGLKL